MNKVKDKKLVNTFGDALLDRGFTSFPNLLFDNQDKLGLNDAEMLFFMKCFRFNGKSVKQLDLKMSSGRSQVWRMKKSLIERGYLESQELYFRDEKGKINCKGTLYNWSGMISRLRSVVEHGEIPAITDETAGCFTVEHRKNKAQIDVKSSVPCSTEEPVCSTEEPTSATMEHTLNESSKGIFKGINSTTKIRKPKEADRFFDAYLLAYENLKKEKIAAVPASDLGKAKREWLDAGRTIEQWQSFVNWLFSQEWFKKIPENAHHLHRAATINQWAASISRKPKVDLDRLMLNVQSAIEAFKREVAMGDIVHAQRSWDYINKYPELRDKYNFKDVRP